MPNNNCSISVIQNTQQHYCSLLGHQFIPQKHATISNVWTHATAHTRGYIRIYVQYSCLCVCTYVQGAISTTLSNMIAHLAPTARRADSHEEYGVEAEEELINAQPIRSTRRQQMS